MSEFLWGAATAAHQVEGGNTNNDWWEWEHRDNSPCAEPSGDACDHYHRYGDDIGLLASLGFDTYRFSLEWSRIEPAPGEFSLAQLDHYRRVCESCLEHGVTPMVTLHHFTNPAWLGSKGYWESGETPELFARYAAKAVEHLGDLVNWWCTINEPNIVALLGYRLGFFPPGKRDTSSRQAATSNFVRGHQLAMQAIRASSSSAKAGITLSMTDYQLYSPQDDHESGLEKAIRNLDRIRAKSEDVFLRACTGDDFIGVQTYSRSIIGPSGAIAPGNGARLTQMGYELYPEAIGATLRRAWEIGGGVPLIVTENGIGTTEDAERIEHTEKALAEISKCISDGIGVSGYIHWSLMDNFEWTRGYEPTFGLVAADRQPPFSRRPKPSASWLGGVAKQEFLGSITA